MCFFSKKPSKPAPPAAAPPAPLPPPVEQDIGTKRKQENKDNFGSTKPSFRVNRDGGGAPLQNDKPISF